MKIDPSTPAREVLIRYLETSGVTQQKEAAAEMRKMEGENLELYNRGEYYKNKAELYDSMYRQLLEKQLTNKPSLTSRIALWFKKGK